MASYEALEKKIGISFNTKALLKQALTHRSYHSKKELEDDNERLEYFGDAVLKLIVTDYLYHKFPELNEGDLTKKRAGIIADKCLSLIAEKLDLGKYMRFSYGENQSGGRNKTSNLANALEALIGAIYLDKGYEDAKHFFLSYFEKSAKRQADSLRDFKTELQEYAQKKYKNLPSYALEKEEGPEHDKIFHISVSLTTAKETLKAKGAGSSKKEAEQSAAKSLIETLNL